MSLITEKAPELTRAPSPYLLDERLATGKRSLTEKGFSAIHGGKLGDIIYALPVCRALGIDHLILQTYEGSDDPLRVFPYAAAAQIVPLLLSQSYLRRVSIARNASPADYDLDRFREVARHRVGKIQSENPESFAQWVPGNPPAHLIEHFAAAQGIEVDGNVPWLHAPSSPHTAGKVVVSLTQNWRSYSDNYWKSLLDGLDDIQFVGTETEWKRSGLTKGHFQPASDHLELASLIAGAALFLGTVSFPYALAEGLKVPRLVEVCQWNLNAFPLGKGGQVLPPSVSQARRKILSLLPGHLRAQYQKVSRQQAWSPRLKIQDLGRILNSRFTWANQSRTQVARWYGSRLYRKIRSLLETVGQED